MRGDSRPRRPAIPFFNSRPRIPVVVAANARDLGRDLGCSPEEVLHIQSAGLLHDVGGTPSSQRLSTFNDPQSVDHGERAMMCCAGSAFARLSYPAATTCWHRSGITTAGRARRPESVRSGGLPKSSATPTSWTFLK